MGTCSVGTTIRRSSISRTIHGFKFKHSHCTSSICKPPLSPPDSASHPSTQPPLQHQNAGSATSLHPFKHPHLSSCSSSVALCHTSKHCGIRSHTSVAPHHMPERCGAQSRSSVACDHALVSLKIMPSCPITRDHALVSLKIMPWCHSRSCPGVTQDHALVPNYP